MVKQQRGSARYPAHRPPPPPVPARNSRPDATAEITPEERRIQALLDKQTEAAEELRKLLGEAHGLSKDIRADTQRQQAAKADLRSMLDSLIEQRNELRGAVQNTLERIVTREVDNLRRQMKHVLGHETEVLKNYVNNARDQVEDYHARLLGLPDSQALIDYIVKGVFDLIKSDMEDLALKDIASVNSGEISKMMVITSLRRKQQEKPPHGQ
jgi:hypothetical protein